MMNIAICDDLELDRKHLVTLVQEYGIRLVYEFTIMTFASGEELVAYYLDEQLSFDIIFLDIYMGKINGIKTAEKIREFDLQCKIIFTTTSTDHALDSFRVFPFNYLLKPITKWIFDPVFEQALLTIDKERNKSITIKSDHGIRNILYKDLIFIESNGRKLHIHNKNEIISIYSKLDEIEIKLQDIRFLRCHKSFLVNMDYISRVDEYSFILTETTEIAITQRSFASIKKMYYSYIVNKPVGYGSI